MEWYAPIDVSEHACRRAQERLRWTGIGVGVEIVSKIRADVREHMVFGRLTQLRPEWLPTGRIRTEKEQARVHYAYDQDATRCWLLTHGTSRKGLIVVVTVMRAQHFDEVNGGEHRLRQGMVRR